jgi:beta-mannosidase
MGLHWSIHGPWNVDGPLDARWETYWQEDDSLFRAETGCPGAMDPDRLASYVPSLQVFPIQQDNPVWGRNSWWIESDVFEMERGRKPHDAHEYCQWSQERQAGALKIAVGSTKQRFPAVGGIIIWMGHDSFACAANTSIIDVDGVPKPAYGIVKELFNTPHDQEGCAYD